MGNQQSPNPHYSYPIMGTTTAQPTYPISVAPRSPRLSLLTRLTTPYIFQPPHCTYNATCPHPVQWFPSAEPHVLLPAYFMWNPNNQYNGLTILYAHGNASDLGSNFALLRSFYNLGVHVFAFDYPGYGMAHPCYCPFIIPSPRDRCDRRSKRPHVSTTEQGVLMAAEGAFRYLHCQLGIPMDRILVMGTSLGSASASHLASKYGACIAGCILETPFCSIASIIPRQYQLLVKRIWDMFDNESCMRNVSNCPVLIIHGTMDNITPFEHGVILHEIAQKNGCWTQLIPVIGAGHGDFRTVMGESCYHACLRRFFDVCCMYRKRSDHYGDDDTTSSEYDDNRTDCEAYDYDYMVPYDNCRYSHLRFDRHRPQHNHGCDRDTMYRY